MKQVLKAMGVVLILAGSLMAQQEVSPDFYPDKSPAAEQHQVAAKKQPVQKKAVVAKKATHKATLVAARTSVKAPSTRRN